MRITAEILLFPLTILLTIFVAVIEFLTERISVLFNIFSGIVFLAGLVSYAEYFLGFPFDRIGHAPTLQLAIISTIFAFILSPYGLPCVAFWLTAKLDELNDTIKSI